MHFVAALEDVDGMRCALRMFEHVVSGAADGYAGMAGMPAAALLHPGSGLAKSVVGDVEESVRAAIVQPAKVEVLSSPEKTVSPFSFPSWKISPCASTITKLPPTWPPT